MDKRQLPIGMQTFAELRERDCYYVDKTAYIAKMAREGKHYFLSRPRRFGKSLFLDTCKEAFEGNEPLFRGLDIHGACRWDWDVRHPVLRLSFGSGHFTAPGGVEAHLLDQLATIEDENGVVSRATGTPARLAALLGCLRQSAGRRVVVLVDEYDKPVLDTLDNPEIVRANCDFLRAVYGVF